MKVYVAGPISGFDLEERRRTFAAAVERLRAAGHEPVNPFDLHPNPIAWADAMKADIPALVICDAIYLQDGWWNSRGARLEELIAVQLGLKIWYEHDDTRR